MSVRFFLPLFEFAETGNTVLWTTVLLCPILIFILRRRKVTDIPGPAGLPFLGYLPFLGNDPHLTLFKLSEKYGSISGIRFIERTSMDGATTIQCNGDEAHRIRRFVLGKTFTEKELVGTVQVMLCAGGDTAKGSLKWLFFAMATYLDIQDKVQEELDRVLSEGEIPCWNDRGKLPYCQAAVLEGQRWRTLVPLNLLHRTSEDTDIRGFVIPKETDVIAMIWAFHNDTKYWKDPEKFIPERFLTEDGKRIKKLEIYAPFSVGKRLCTGNTLASIEIFIYFTSIMHTFGILPAEGALLDLKGTLGLTLQPKNQLLRFVSRK